jgi:uncharacterized SAM-binding protein YcdF (DUF218 family)
MMTSRPSEPVAKPPSSGCPPRRCFGIFTKQQRWGLSLRGWLVMISLVLLATVLWLLNIQPFLAMNKRVDTKILVVEGWMPPFAMKATVEEFQAGHYEKVYTTGGPVIGSGGYVNDFNTLASVGAELLVAAGLPADVVQMVPSHVSGRDRTYSSAVALRDWLRQHRLNVTAINVVSEDVHARRTWLLFQRAFGAEVKVGIIAIPNPDYQPKRWWRYSEGVREILGESIAYGYAKFIFSPEKATAQVP